jgi:hypothetical protein
VSAWLAGAIAFGSTRSLVVGATLDFCVLGGCPRLRSRELIYFGFENESMG